MKRYGVPHPYPLPSLWRSSHQEFSWADSQPYGIPISVEFLQNTSEIVIFRHFWAGADLRRLRDAAPDRSFISQFLKILFNFIIDLSFLEI